MFEPDVKLQAGDLPQWLEEQGAVTELADIVLLFAEATAEIAEVLRNAPANGHTGAAGSINVQGEEQKQLDIISHEITVEALAASPYIAGLVSEEVPELMLPPAARAGAPYIVCFDPLDGSSNLEVNGAVGSIFSVLGRKAPERPCSEADVLASADNQLAAGYVLFGPATLLVLTLGKKVAMFALEPGTESFCQVEDEVRIPESASEFSINMAHQQHWEPPVADYIAECLQGEQGPRRKKFNMRWAGAMVADMQRIFVRGGIFIYPALTSAGGESGKLRFLYEANPMALLAEAAGGEAIARAETLRSIRPTRLHQRVPVAIGSRDEIRQLASHHASL